MCPRHQTGLDRATKENDDEEPYHCRRNDCRRVVWFDSIPDSPSAPQSFKVMGCYECGRQTRFVRCDVPPDTIFLDSNGDPVPKSEEKEVNIEN